MSGKLGRRQSLPVTELTDTLECPICAEVPHSTPIYQCENGHILCKKCHKRLSNCPLCRKPLGKIRSLVAEKMLEKVPLPCSFADDGCRTHIFLDDRQFHQVGCKFRTVQCPKSTCKSRISLNKLLLHLQECHKDFFNGNAKSSMTDSFKIEKEMVEKSAEWNPSHLSRNDNPFFFQKYGVKPGMVENPWRPDKTKELWHFWVYMAGTPLEAEEFFCEFKIRGHSQHEILMYTGPVISIDVPFEEVITSELGLCFSNNVAKRLFKEEGYIEFSVAIKSKAEFQDIF